MSDAIVTGDHTTFVVKHSLDDLAKADPGDVQAIASSQLGLLASFYEVALDQAKKSFRWAVAGSVVGIVFFMAAVAFVLGSGEHDAALVSAISGGVVEVIAGINFVLYGKTAAQLLGFHTRLEQTQRFLLANSICESIEPAEVRSNTRASLVAILASGGASPGTEPPV